MAWIKMDSALTILAVTCLVGVGSQEITTTGVTIEGTSGDTVRLECTATDWNAIAHTEWKRLYNGTWERIVNHGVVMRKYDYRHKAALASSNAGRTLTSILTIQKVELADAGLYRCEVHRSGTVQSYTQHILTVFQHGTKKALPIEQVSMGARAATSAFVSWSAPIGRDPEVERWFYQVHMRFVENGKIQGRIVQVPEADSTSVTVTELFPCTTYKVWLSGHSQRFEGNKGNNGATRTNRTLLPGAYRRSVSSRQTSFQTLHFVPLETPLKEDIQVEIQKTGTNNCSMHVTWSPRHVPFGCPVLGLKLKVLTPESWPEFLSVTAEGSSVEAYGFRENMAFPVSLTAYNKFGDGVSSVLFFVPISSRGPPAPEDLVATTPECNEVLVTWGPPSGNLQKIRIYKLLITQSGSNTRFSRRIPGDQTKLGLSPAQVRPFSRKRGTLLLHLTAISDWGESRTTKAVLDLPAAADCLAGGQRATTTPAAPIASL